ncbi:MAG: phage Gp37/Gp68 family protein [Phycisphaera sp.]|nr:MAG: phage Gp37/Gp68 family protein [Phycisphaera sp.]
MKVDLTINKSRGVHRTEIEWADYSANPIRARDRVTGEVGWACRKVSAGCANCYAEALNKRFGTKHPYTAAGLGQVEQVLDEGVLRKLLTMRPRGPFKNGRERPAVFLGDMMDLFYGDEADERAAKAAGVPFAPIPFEMLDPIFAVIALRTDMDILVLTKRPGRMREYLESRKPTKSDRSVPPEWLSQMNDWRDPKSGNWSTLSSRAVPQPNRIQFPLANFWGGTSVESDEVIDRVDEVRRCPLAVRFLSCEPLIGPLTLRRVPIASDRTLDSLTGTLRTLHVVEGRDYGIDWVIVGGESGRGARPCDLAWIRGVVEQCREAKVPCFVKQLGSNPLATLAETGTDETDDDNVERLELDDPKGGDPAEWPEDLRVRKMPGGGQ